MSCKKHKGSGELFAVKQVKLPSAATNLEAFERQVACVLRDVEVNYLFDTEISATLFSASPTLSLVYRMVFTNTFLGKLASLTDMAHGLIICR